MLIVKCLIILQANAIQGNVRLMAYKMYSRSPICWMNIK